MPAEVTLRPVGFARRLGRPVPSGAAVAMGSRFAAILRDLASDPAVQIAGRDGSMSLANPGCTFLDPPTGAAISANRAYNLVGPGGLTLPMYTAFPAIVNIYTAQIGNSNLASNTLVSATLVRTLIENTATTSHLSNAGAASYTLTDGASYRLRAIVGLASGSQPRRARIYFARSGQRAGVEVNIATGAATDTVVGGGATSSITSTSVCGGKWLVECTITNAAWGGTVTNFASILDAAGNETYEGDGASGITLEAVTLVASTLTPLGIAEAATRAADANVWTLPDALTQDEEIIVLSAQCYASGDMGVTNQMWMENVGGISGSHRLIRTDATTLKAIDSDGAAKEPTITRTIADKGVINQQRWRRSPNSIQAGYGRSLGAAVAGGTFLTTATGLRLGNSSSNGRDSYALNACIRRKGGFSQAQIDALYYGFANGRTVPVVA